MRAQNYNQYVKVINGVRVLTVMATKNEYRDKLKATGITPLITGVGPVSAAKALTLALIKLKEQDNKSPLLVVNMGSAGSSKLEQGEVYQASSSQNRHVDATGFGFPQGKVPFSEYSGHVTLPKAIKGIKSASSSTGANVVTDYTTIEDDMVEMEFDSLMRVCLEDFNVPIIGLKGISDGKEPLTGKRAEWEKLLPKIDENLAIAYKTITTALQTEGQEKDQLLQMPQEWHYVQARESVRNNGDSFAEALKPLTQIHNPAVKAKISALQEIINLVKENPVESFFEKLLESAKKPEVTALLSDKGRKDLFITLTTNSETKSIIPDALREGGELIELLTNVEASLSQKQQDTIKELHNKNIAAVIGR